MTKACCAIAAASVVALSPTCTVALSLMPRPRPQSGIRPAAGNGLFGKRSVGAAGGWTMPSFRSSKSLLSRIQSTKDKEEEELFFVADDGNDDGDGEEKSWPVKPTPPPEPPKAPPAEPITFVAPPKPVIPETRLVVDPSIVEKLDPLLNPTITKAVPAETIQGAGIGGVLLALLASVFLFGPLSIPSLGTLIAAASAGIIAAYVSITEGAAGDFARSAGRTTAGVTEWALEGAADWELEKEVGRIADALLTPPPTGQAAPPKGAAASEAVAAAAAVADSLPLTEGLTAEEAEEVRVARLVGGTAAEEGGDTADRVAEGQTAEEAAAARNTRLDAADEAAAALVEEAKRVAEAEAAEEEEKALRARMRAEEETRAAEEARLQAEEDARWKAEEEAVAQARAKAAEEEARRKAEEDASRAQAEEEARLRAEEDARELAEAEEATRLAEEEARLKAEEEATRLAEEEARLKAEEEAARLAEEEARLEAEEETRRLAEEAARLRAEEEAEDARRLADQASAAREAVRLMEEQEAAMANEDDDALDDDDWEASVRLANELQGLAPPSTGGDVADAISDDLLQMEIDDLTAEEENALGRAAREAVRKYEEEMAMKSVQKKAQKEVVADTPPPPAEDPIDEIDEVEEAAADVDYSKMTVVQLKEVLRSKGLKVSGKKAVLVERLMESS